MTHLTLALSTDAWRVLTDAIRQQQALQVQRQQQYQQDQQQRQQLQKQQHQQQPAAPLADPPAPPAVPYTHIDHFNNREGVSFLHSAIHRSGAQSIAANLQANFMRQIARFYTTTAKRISDRVSFDNVNALSRHPLLFTTSLCD